jgi:hypothetical protein
MKLMSGNPSHFVPIRFTSSQLENIVGLVKSCSDEFVDP